MHGAREELKVGGLSDTFVDRDMKQVSALAKGYTATQTAVMVTIGSQKSSSTRHTEGSGVVRTELDSKRNLTITATGGDIRAEALRCHAYSYHEHTSREFVHPFSAKCDDALE